MSEPVVTTSTESAGIARSCTGRRADWTVAYCREGHGQGLRPVGQTVLDRSGPAIPAGQGRPPGAGLPARSGTSRTSQFRDRLTGACSYDP